MAGRKKKSGAPEFPKELIITIAGTPDKPYYSVVTDMSLVARDSRAGVYRLKKKRVIKVTRTLVPEE